MPKYPQLPRSIYVQMVDTVKQSGVAENGINLDFEVKFDLKGKGQLSPKTKLSSMDLNQGDRHLWSKIIDPSLKGWGVMAQGWRTRTCRQRQINDNTRRLKLASGKNNCMLWCSQQLWTGHLEPSHLAHGLFLRNYANTKFKFKPCLMMPWLLTSQSSACVMWITYTVKTSQQF